MNIKAMVLGCALLVASPLFAREKTDVLVMNNGDRLTCEIRGLDAGVLYVSFDYIQGVTSVDWLKVRYIESEQTFLVRTESGAVYTGTLSTAEIGASRPARIEIAEAAGTTVPVEQRQLVTINQTSDHFWQRFNGAVNSGLTYSRGNQSTQYTIDTELQYPRERWAAGGRFDSTLSGSTGDPTSTRNDGSFFLRRNLGWENWFYTGVGDFLQSSEQGISLQSNVGGGVGHYLKNTNRARIAIIGGFAFQNTQYSQIGSRQSSQNTAAGFTGLDLELFKFDRTNLTVLASAFPSVSDPGRIYAKTDLTYYVKIYSDFTWNFNFYGNWDNQPPPHFSGSNYGTSMGLGWTFGNK